MMKEEDTVNLLRHYRHDWLNTVQLLMGYTSLGKTDKVQEKLKESVDNAEQERKLVNLNMPKTALWMIGFNWRHDNFRIEYKVEIDNKNLSNYDESLHLQLEETIHLLKAHATQMELYTGTFLFRPTNDQGVELELSIAGMFEQIEELERKLLKNQNLHKVLVEPLQAKKYQCTINWLCN
ncbi:Spo0B domain-containing protein [Aquibacillus saliphilus]|uniref:Spo0B domain-containing protein n=1 Tax=Aquibacillus saliphilus TaxID=1909422 RepID=UPI001CF0B8FC|nr:Spo0B domain-containing protein [Aquibacillus saliphilus]